MSSLILESLVNHVFLPPQNPGKSDAAIHGLSEAFIERILKATLLVRDSGDPVLFSRYDQLRIVLQSTKRLNSEARLDKDSLFAEFQDLEGKSFLVLFVTEQNAGLLLWMDDRYGAFPWPYQGLLDTGHSLKQ